MTCLTLTGEFVFAVAVEGVAEWCAAIRWLTCGTGRSTTCGANIKSFDDHGGPDLLVAAQVNDCVLLLPNAAEVRLRLWLSCVSCCASMCFLLQLRKLARSLA